MAGGSLIKFNWVKLFLETRVRTSIRHVQLASSRDGGTRTPKQCQISRNLTLEAKLETTR